MYVVEAAAANLLDRIEIAGQIGRIFRPAAMMRFCQCNEVSHKAADNNCPAHAPDGL